MHAGGICNASRLALGRGLNHPVGCVVARSVGCQAPDAVNGHSLDKERNDAAGASGRNPEGTGLSGRMAVLRRLAVE